MALMQGPAVQRPASSTLSEEKEIERAESCVDTWMSVYDAFGCLTILGFDRYDALRHND